MKEFFQNKTILITGGTGSLGKELVKSLKQYDCKIIVYSRDEGKQALSFGKDDRVTTIIGDIRDYDKLLVSFKKHKPDYVIHTAALKRIDDMEFHPDECVKTNIQGSENVARASLESGVKKCILISTDKACQPVNVYGSSKFIAERIFTNYDYNSSETIFSSVRYGNVIASRGSFIPLWMDMINQNKKITVTDTQMTRFLFTLDDAVDTVLNALYHSVGGEVFVPKINSYTILDVVNALSSITNKPVNYDVVGIRPGEKLHEDMLAITELPFTYRVPNINLLQVRPQYTNKTHQDWLKYDGVEFNSSLYLSNDLNELIDLIQKGITCDAV
jgi:FlaA1/EpsC-like NDP-sugar epimerase